MKVKTLAAIITGLFIAGCGGGGGDDTSAAATTPASSTNTPGAGSDSAGTNAGASDSGAGASSNNNGAGASSNTAPAGTGNTASTAPTSAQYLTQTSQTAQTEKQTAQAATEKTRNPEVKALAQQLIIELNVINQQITQVAQTMNVTINNNLTTQQQTQINNLNGLSGNEFDRAYVAGLVESWQNLLTTTLMQARQGTDVQVKQTASANILIIEQRLVAAEELLVVLQPTEYLIDAAEDSQFEIQLAQVALQKASNAQVKTFAQRMIDDHTQMNTQVAALAQQKNVTLPTALSPLHREFIALISGFSGADFDKAYMDRNVLSHAEDVSKTMIESQRGSDADIKALAAQSLPVLQQHLQLALSIDSGLQASAVYRLGQSLLTEIQCARLAEAHATSAQVKARAQQIITQDQTAYAQYVQLAQRQNTVIPLIVVPARVQALLQLLHADNGTDVDNQLQVLLDQQITESLQIAQSLQTNATAGISNFASLRIQALQSMNAAGGQATPTGNTGSTGSTTTSTAGTTTTSAPAGSTTTGATTTSTTGATTTSVPTGATTTTATTGTTTTLGTGTTTTTSVPAG